MNTADIFKPSRYIVYPLRGLILIISIAIVFVLGAYAIVSVFTNTYEDRIFPGVSMGWMDLSGLTKAEAKAIIAEQLDYPTQGNINLHFQDKEWSYTPAELGLLIAPEDNAAQAFDIGRSGSLGERLQEQYKIWSEGVELTPKLVYDEQTTINAIERVASQIDRPVIDATLSIDGYVVNESVSQTGRRVNVGKVLDLVSAKLMGMHDADIAMIVEETAPRIEDVSEEAAILRRFMSSPLVIEYPEATDETLGPWELEREVVAKMATLIHVNSGDNPHYDIEYNTQALQVFLQDLAPDLTEKPVNARFIFNDDTKELDLLESAVIGQELNITATVTTALENLKSGKHAVVLQIDKINPPAKDDTTAAELGITELVSSHTSYYYGSSAGRIQNIKTAASRFHGLLIAPGETFSMGEALGDVSLDTGFAEALIIYGNRTIKGVGGGVCQVSTTLFRTAFFGGFPIVERSPHAYRVYYYEQTSSGGIDPRLAGLDATVYFPLVDLKFTNDSDSWLLMETYPNSANRTLTWKFYSTSDGRTVNWHSTGLKNKKDPLDTVYEENPELKKGEIKQVDWEATGADVTVSRYVYSGDELLFEDFFATHYRPWAAVCQYGPGTPGMPPVEPDPDNPCKPVTKKK